MTNRLAILSLLFLFLYIPAFSQITYISEDGTGDGSSWSQSAGDLEQVLINAQPGDEIWVAAGTYRPDECSDCNREDREDRFEIPNQVQLYGGFAGTETQRNQRDWKNNETILSGDIDQDSQPDSNAFTIVYFENVDSTTIIDGFTIRDGCANDAMDSAESLGRSGAGIYNNGTIYSAPTIQNCKFLNHFADAYGAAIYNNGRNGGRANPSIVNCSFLGNYAIRSGGAILNDGGHFLGESSPLIDHSFFQNNTSTFGGAIYNNGFDGTSSPRILNSTFTENTATSIGGAVYSFAKSDLGFVGPLFANCLFVGNYGKSSGAVYTLASGGTGRPLILNSVFYENSANTGGAVYCNESVEGDLEVTMYNNIFFGNTAYHNSIFHMSGSGTPTMKLYSSMVDALDCEDIAQVGDGDSLLCGSGIIYNQDPLFVDPANFDFSLQLNSPAVDAGDNQIIIDNNILYDIDSLARIFNGQVDLGAFELDVIYIPTNFTTQPISQFVCEEEGVLFDIQTNGTDPVSYQWYKDGQSLPGADEEDLFLNNIILSDTGSYYLEIVTAIGEVLVSDTASLTALAVATPALVIVASDDNICASTPVTFTIDTVDFEGDNPTYQWLRNDDEVGLDQPFYSTQSLSDGDKVRCVLTSSRPCVTTELVSSNSIFMEVTETVIPTISILADVAEVCAEDAVTFNANINNGGAMPQIEWLKNGVVINQNTTTITLNDLASDDIIEAKVISSELCAISQPVFSNEISVEVIELATMNISITSNSQEICQGESVTFTATSENTGSSPTYQWLINGNDIVDQSMSTFIADNLNDGDQVSCRITSTEPCLEENILVSELIELTVNPLLQLSTEIMANQTEICAGEMVDFTSTITNGGVDPTYQWLINGNIVGQNTSTFTANDLNDGDRVSLEVSSSESCLVTNRVASSEIIIQVNPVLPLTVSITANVTSICEGESSTFTAVPLNAGNNPDYQWMVNGVNVGNNAAIYTASDLSENDQVSCRITSVENCLVSNVASSESLTLDVIESVVPTVSITSNDAEICENESATFTAQILNGGSVPIIQWYLNDVEVGMGEMSLTLDQLNSNDTISVNVISSSSCASTGPVRSEGVTISVLELGLLSVVITAETEIACAGETLTFTATAQNGGEDPTYIWAVNGTEVVDNNSSVLEQVLMKDAEITCTVVSQKNCLAENMVSSEIYSVTVNEVIDPAISIVLTQDSICLDQVLNFSAAISQEGSNPEIEWLVNGATTGNSGEFFTVDDLESGDIVTAVLSVTEECTIKQSIISNEVNIDFSECNIVGVETIIGNQNINVFPNPVAEKFDIQLTDFYGEMNIGIYDLYGRLFYQKEMFIDQNLFVIPINSQSFPAGTYFISLKNKKINNITRVIVR